MNQNLEVSVRGSLKILILGGVKVKTKNNRAIVIKAATAAFFDLHATPSELNSRASYIYAVAADTKKIAMLIKSGDLPITPL